MKYFEICFVGFQIFGLEFVGMSASSSRERSSCDACIHPSRVYKPLTGSHSLTFSLDNEHYRIRTYYLLLLTGDHPVLYQQNCKFVSARMSSLLGLLQLHKIPFPVSLQSHIFYRSTTSQAILTTAGEIPLFSSSLYLGNHSSLSCVARSLKILSLACSLPNFTFT